MLHRRIPFPRLKNVLNVKIIKRGIDTACGAGNEKKGLVLGAYEDCEGEIKLSAAGSKFDIETGNRITDLLKGTKLPVGKTRVFNNLGKEFYAVAIAGVGPESIGYNEGEVLDECKEGVRIGAGAGAQALQNMGVADIQIEGFTNSEAAAEGATLALWSYQDFKDRTKQKLESTISLYDDPDKDGWQSGQTKAQSQNIVRRLENAPGNLMTPEAFSRAAIDILCPCGVQVEVRDREWLAEKNMTAILAMARGSCAEPLFLELSYCGGGEGDKPVVLTGKGVTFDSGGLSLKHCEGMSDHRADMAGAAVIVGVMRALAILGIPVNVNGCIPLLENMPGARAMKPGDVIVGLNGKTIQLEDIDNEGRVILADALTYTHQFKSCLNINIGTFTDAVRAALGSCATPVFSTSETVWNELKKSGADTGDRVWRFPAWKLFSDKVNCWPRVDLHNVGKGRGGDPCLGAAFLLEFAPPVDFIHMDITGTGMKSSGNPPYLQKGFMTGRPTRTLIQFFNRLACPLDRPTTC